MKQRAQLRNSGLASSHVIWALHSESTTELLTSIACLQKSEPTWEELRSLGVGWWLTNPALLRTIVEKIAKTAFQSHNDPMDAALYYLAMRKKNVVTHLFRSARDSKMAEFFGQDFDAGGKWKKAAQKNAFVLMGKQRFAHAAAFFLLGGSLTDALQTCLVNLNDLQLVLVIIRLFENDPDKQSALLKQVLCRNVLGVEVEELAERSKDDDAQLDLEELPLNANPDPFVRSMAYWHLKEYSRACSTLLDAAFVSGVASGIGGCEASLSTIFNFYSYLRRHPLVIRHKLADAGVQIGSTDKFLQVCKQMENRITPAERRLYFRTASFHLKGGCPMLALDVLCRLPRHLCLVLSNSSTLGSLVAEDGCSKTSLIPTSPPPIVALSSPQKADQFDWGEALVTEPPKRVMKDDPLELKWSDEEEEERGLVMKSPPTNALPDRPVTVTATADNGVAAVTPTVAAEPKKGGPLDIMAQQLKFVACLKILMEELANLASGFKVEGGHLRQELYLWLEKEVEVLKGICDYNTAHSDIDHDVFTDSDEHLKGGISDQENGVLLLHEAIKNDRADLDSRIKLAVRRHEWLASNQQLLRSLTSYCALHGTQGVGLTSARMELLLLLLELQQEPSGRNRQLAAPLPLPTHCPLLSASVAAQKTDVAGPLSFLRRQAADLLIAIADMQAPPTLNNLSKVYLLYNLSQCLSASLYESLSDVESLSSVRSANSCLLNRVRTTSKLSSTTAPDSYQVSTLPSKWPGVPELIALLSRESSSSHNSGQHGAGDEDTPQLRHLLAECFVAVYTALFAYAFTAYDSRWLYRLAGHGVDPAAYASIFGGGAPFPSATHIRSTSAKGGPALPPPRPARPPAKTSSSASVERDSSPSVVTMDRFATAVDPNALRAKFHAKVFGGQSPSSSPTLNGPIWSATQLQSTDVRPPTTVLKWVPPKKSMAAFFLTKPPVNVVEDLGIEYDSDDSQSDADSAYEQNLDDFGESVLDNKQHQDPHSYAWAILRLALLKQCRYRIVQFLSLASIELTDVPTCLSLVQSVLNSFDAWEMHLADALERFAGGCPTGFLPHTHVDAANSGPSLRKYRTILEPNNTPFEIAHADALPVKRLWLYLVRQEHLMDVFIRHIFRPPGVAFKSVDEGIGSTTLLGGDLSSTDDAAEPIEAIKIVQREQDPITAFAVSAVATNPGWVVVSTGRELQEMDVSLVLNNQSRSNWLRDPTELDIALSEIKRDPLKDNDDYMLLMDQSDRKEPGSFLCKRQVSGIRRMQAHPNLPYYVSGAQDGSVRVWEWGVGQPLYTARAAGQYAKVCRVRFSPNGNKFGAGDADGLLYLWQISVGMNLKRPFFKQKCHGKSLADFQFLGDSSSLLVTAGLGVGDQNLALWDCLLPHNKSLVQSWSCHPEGAMCAVYVANQHTLVSGGRHGELCFWDLRQRQLRSSIKAFDSSSVVKAIALDPTNSECFVCGSSEGDIKVYTISGGTPQLAYALPGEHTGKTGFSLRAVGTGQVQGVQQLLIDGQQRLYSCGADCSFKVRNLAALLQNC